MSTDRELLELAAKVADLGFVPSRDSGSGIIGGVLHKPWNPLTDDGDALRLAVKLGICIQTEWRKGFVSAGSISTVLLDGDEALSVTRRAIVRAAAELGKAMP